MPLKLIPPRPPKNPNWSIRGTYLGNTHFRDGRSAGTPEKRIAREVLAKHKRDIESGCFRDAAETTFSSAVKSYVNAGYGKRFLTKIVLLLGNRPISTMTQEVIDAAAVSLYPNATAATRNRQVYTPVSAVLRHAGAKTDLRRPKGARGRRRKVWLEVDQAFRLLDAAEALDARFGALCVFLLYTGARLSDGLHLTWDKVDLVRGEAYIPDTKNGEPRLAYLPPDAVTSLANLPGPRFGNVFGYSKTNLLQSTELYGLFRQACTNAGIQLEAKLAFHIFCHTYGTWMVRYCGATEDDLVATDRWKSREIASDYAHRVVQAAARKADGMPVRKSVR